MKRKKFWKVFAFVILGLLVLISGIYFVTKLSKVSVEFRTRREPAESELQIGILEKVKKDAAFDYKKSVLFINTKDNVKRIEKENPYVKVNQVLRKFPNKICIYISERIPKYRIKDSENVNVWYILDDEFKVLKSYDATETSIEDLTKIEKTTVEVNYVSQKTSVGEFLNKPQILSNLNSIMSGVHNRTKDYFAVKAIDYNGITDTYTLSMKSSGTEYAGGCELKIIGSTKLQEMAFKATSVYVDYPNSEDNNGSIDFSKKVLIELNSLDNDCIVKNVA